MKMNKIYNVEVEIDNNEFWTYDNPCSYKDALQRYKRLKNNKELNKCRIWLYKCFRGEKTNIFFRDKNGD